MPYCGRSPFSRGTLRRHQLTAHKGETHPRFDVAGRPANAGRSGTVAAGAPEVHGQGDGTLALGERALLRDSGAPQFANHDFQDKDGVEGAAGQPNTDSLQCTQPDARRYDVENDGQRAMLQEPADEIVPLLRSTRQEILRPERGQKRRRGPQSDGCAAKVAYPSVTTHVRGVYEAFRDAARSAPLVEQRARSKAGMLNTGRLRFMKYFAFKTGGCGLSGSGTRDLWDLFRE